MSCTECHQGVSLLLPGCPAPSPGASVVAFGGVVVASLQRRFNGDLKERRAPTTVLGSEHGLCHAADRVGERIAALRHG